MREFQKNRSSQRVLAVEADPTWDERQWVDRLLERESGAWVEFVRRFGVLVHSVIRRTAARLQIRLQSSDVDDLAGDVFAAALKALEQFRQESRLSTWLVSIARRVVRRELRRRRVRAVRDVSREECEDRSTCEPLDHLLLHERRERLEATLNVLPSAYRDVLRLHYVDRLSYRAIGRRLGVSANSVGPLLARGRRRLRELLRKEADSGEIRMMDARDS